MGGPAGGRTDGIVGWMGGRRTDGQTEIDFSYYQFVCRRYTELIRPMPEDAIAEVS